MESLKQSKHSKTKKNSLIRYIQYVFASAKLLHVIMCIFFYLIFQCAYKISRNTKKKIRKQTCSVFESDKIEEEKHYTRRKN